MAQLIMRWKNDGATAHYPDFPQNVTLRYWSETEAPIEKWLDIVQYGLTNQKQDEAFYHKCNDCYPYYTPESCYFFCLNGREIATITVICDPEKKEGYVHMVAAAPESRGKGIGNLMSLFAVYILKTKGMQTAYLTTDDFRLPAIKTYLNAGFTPDLTTEEDFAARWEEIFRLLHKKK